MKLLLYIFPILIASCGQPNNQDHSPSYVDSTETKVKLFVQTSDTMEISEQLRENITITFNEVVGKAVLIGENINLLNSELKAVTTLEEGTIVSIIGLSDSLFQKTDDYCDAFHYVKIKTNSGNGIVDGRNVYQIINSGQDTSLNYQKRKFESKATEFFGIGVSDDDGLTFCSKYYEPILLTEKESNNPKLVKVVKNSFSKEASWNDDFQYFELMANDGAYDKIQKVQQTDNGVLLTIKREFQEGWNIFQVRLVLDTANYTAEYLSYGEIQY